MKKFLSLILALALVMSLGTVAFAANNEKSLTSSDGETWDGDGEASAKNTVKADVKVEASAPSVTLNYKVTISWDDMKFTYDFGDIGTWDVSDETPEYTGGSEGSWSSTNANINVKNYSNAGVKVDASAAKDAGALSGNLANVTLSIDGGMTHTLESAENAENPYTAQGAPTTHTFTVKVEGAPKEAIVEETTLGTVTLTLSKPTV